MYIIHLNVKFIVASIFDILFLFDTADNCATDNICYRQSVHTYTYTLICDYFCNDTQAYAKTKIKTMKKNKFQCHHNAINYADIF